MELPQPKRLHLWTPLLFALVMILGMWLGFKLHDTLRNKRDLQTVMERNDRLESIIDLINERYVDTINTNALYRDAVKGILSHLDPHTVYIPADQLASVNETLKGSFYGIGIEYVIRRDTLEVTAVVLDGPSEKAGVAAGDQFISVNDTVIAGKGMTTDRMVEMLRGEQKSTVKVGVKKAGSNRVQPVEITRDEVPLYSVDAALMLDKQTGFIKINRFAATTYDEFAKALKKLKKNGAKQLIIDLRDNPGGYLSEATNIADELLDGDKPIVFTQGLHSKKFIYTADKSGLFEQGKLVVLVDENSASASEILAGAVQDWDRGVIIGRRTYGKGLVQEQYDLDDGSALRLTIARYYTPSGRSIQRSFQQGKEAYDEAFLARYQSGELAGNDSLVKEDTVAYYTANKRVVRGGGGIKPDVYVPYDSSRLSPQLMAILLGDDLQDAVFKYYGGHVAELKKYRSTADFIAHFNGQQEVIDGYLQQIAPAQRSMVNNILLRKANKDFLLVQIKAQLARILFHNNGYYTISMSNDPMVQRALQVFYTTDQYLKIISR